MGGSRQDWSTSCAWFDYDNDGKLDLFVCNYVVWSKDIDFEVGYKLVGIGRAYGQPRDFPGTFPFLYHNDGNGHFTDVSKRAGVQVQNPVTGAPSREVPGRCGHRLGQRRVAGPGGRQTTPSKTTSFTTSAMAPSRKSARSPASRSTVTARPAAPMGIDAARFRNDDSIGIAIGNFANEMTALYVSQGKPLTFAGRGHHRGNRSGEPLAPEVRIVLLRLRSRWPPGRAHLQRTPRDRDQQSAGEPDLRATRPALLERRGRQGPRLHLRARLQVRRRPLFKPVVGRGSAFADIDGDGDLDVVLAQIGGPPLLLRNEQKLGHHCLRFKLVE